VNRYFIDKVLEYIAGKFDVHERNAMSKMRRDGKLFFLPELIPYFRKTNIFAFGTGGSIDNLVNVDRLDKYNLMITTTGPLYIYRMYGFVPNIWTLTYSPIVDVVLKEEEKTPLDFSNTFILVPSNDSATKIHFSTPVVRELRRRHPEATFVLYRQIIERVLPEKPHECFSGEGREPLRWMGGSILDNLFFPICFFLGVSTIYFSGIDLNKNTGHFWDRNRLYQRMNGTALDFPEKDFLLRCARKTQDIAKEKGKHIYRLEARETVLQNFPYLDFEKAIAEATPQIVPGDVV